MPEDTERGREATERPRKGRKIVMIAAAVFALILAADMGAFKKSLGSDAHAADDCESGLLLQAAGANYAGMCTKKCEGELDCGMKLRCVGGLCAPRGDKELGEACAAAWECKSGGCGFPVMGNALEATGLVCE